jgi:hypothetical protein
MTEKQFFAQFIAAMEAWAIEAELGDIVYFLRLAAMAAAP